MTENLYMIPLYPLSIDDADVTPFWCEVTTESIQALMSGADDHTLDASDVERMGEISAQLADLSAPLFAARLKQFKTIHACELWRDTYISIVGGFLGAHDFPPRVEQLHRIADAASTGADAAAAGLAERLALPRRSDA